MYCSDCIDYAPGGKCRNPKVHKYLVGFFQAPCREFVEKPKTTTTMKEETPTTKVCKVCGQEKPLDAFQRTRNSGHVDTCKECAGKKRKGAAVPAVPPVPSVPSPEWNGTPDLEALKHYTDDDLARELRLRGYAGTLTKANTLTI